MGEADDLLSKWGREEHVESEAPERNRAPWLAAVVAVVVIAVLAGLFLLLPGDDDDDGPGGPRGEDADAPSVTDGDTPTLDDLTAEVTVPPGPEGGLSVVDSGVTVVEDRFDPERREGTYAVVVENPHAGWIAEGVEVEVSFVDAAGEIVGSDRGFVELILPGQTVAVGALFFDAPTADVAGTEVVTDVAHWRETEPVEGEITTHEVETTEAEFSGVRTTFVLRSSFDERLLDVGVTAVYRDAEGNIVGGADTFVDLLEPGTDTPVEITLLANMDVEQIATTELYPAAGHGFGPDGG